MSLVDRRRLLTSGAAAAVLAASGLPLLAKPKSGGLLRAGLSGGAATDSWDARRHAGLFMMAAGQGAVFDTLTEVAADGSLRGELATGWQVSADARTWTFDLRRGVEFHDGADFGADDVIASLMLHADPAARSPALPILQMIDTMRATGPHQVQFTLVQGNADFPYLLSDYHLLIYPGGQIARAMREGIGTGLYRVESFEPGRRFLGRRVRGHWRDGQAGWFDEIAFLALDDAAARRAALQDRIVDAVDSAPLAADRAGLRIEYVPGNRHFAFAMQSGRAPFDNADLRRALKHGLDRQAMLDGLLGGQGRIAADTPIGPANPYFDAALAPLDFDPDKARHHLDRAGTGRVALRLAVPDHAFDGAFEAAEAFRSSAARAGIDIQPVAADTGADLYLTEPFRASGWSGRATEDWMFSTAYRAGAPWNESGWDHPRFEALLLSARSDLDSASRAAKYHEMQRILRDDGAVLVPVFADHVIAARARLAMPATLGNLWPMDNARLAERWWMA